MERYSHIALAKGLLQVAGEDPNMAYLSVVPRIDGEPDFLHRLQAHPLVRGPVLVKCAMNVFGTKREPFPYVPEGTYELERLREERKDLVDTFVAAESKDPSEMAFDGGFGALLSVLSHAYFDTYNNAVQAFAPYEGYCAGQYAMWEKVDYFSYRVKWYRQTAPYVRERVLEEDYWNVNFTAKEMVKALVHRVAALTQPSVKPESIANVERDLQVDDVPLVPEVKDFYIRLEASIERHLVESVS